MLGMPVFFALATLSASPAAPAAAAPATSPVIVFCAPGSPGTTEEARAAMDAFAAALAAGANLPAGGLAATYAPSEQAGSERLRAPDAALAMVSLPFFLKHGRALGLRATGTGAVLQGSHDGPTERWSLVAKKGRVTGPAVLDGLTVLSTAGYAPGFVRAALAGWGQLPAGTRIEPTTGILSALRKASAGEPVAVLLDGAQAAALPTLPFAADLEVVARSPEVPAGVVAAVGKRLPAATVAKLDAALRTLASRPDGAAALAGLRLSGFAPLDPAALKALQQAYAKAGP